MKTLSPAIITLPARDAAEQYFAPISHLPWAMLLHSGHADHPHSRFDIVVADPVCTVKTHGETTQIRDAQGARLTHDDPLTVLQKR